MIKSLEVRGNLVKIKVDRKYENSLLALKAYLTEEGDVDLAGVSTDHYLVDEIEFVVKVNKGDPIDTIKRVIDKAVKDLEKRKIK